MRIRDLILPEDKVFFTLFKEMAEKIVEAATTLNEITHELPGGTEKHTKFARSSTMAMRSPGRYMKSSTNLS